MAQARPRSRRVRLLAAFALVGVIAATVGALAQTSDDDDRDEPAEVELTGEAKALADLLEKRESATYHAKYEGVGPQGARLLVETWQEQPRARQDQVISGDGDELALRTYVLPSGRVSCLRIAEQDWACRPAGADTQAASDPFATIKARIGEGTVTAEDSRVEGRSARCYRFEVDDEQNELCVIPTTGIPVRIRGGSTELRLVALEEDVDQSVFELPGPVQQQ